MRSLRAAFLDAVDRDRRQQHADARYHQDVARIAAEQWFICEGHRSGKDQHGDADEHAFQLPIAGFALAFWPGLAGGSAGDGQLVADIPRPVGRFSHLV